MEETHTLLFILSLFFATGILAGLSWLALRAWLHPRTGDHVAEVWLDWGFCRGSTMYRQRFKSKRAAGVYAKLAAMVIDMSLPTHYADTDYSGRRIYEKHEFAIKFGVRLITRDESSSFTPIWSTTLPGSRGAQGEHAMSHPVFGDAPTRDALSGFKI